MKKFITGTKLQMTQVFNEDGVVFPATVLKAETLKVTQVKTSEKDGYKSVQFGVGVEKEKNVNKAQKKHGNFKYYKEAIFDESVPQMNVGDTLDLGVFEKGDVVEVSAISKGKGFQGPVKRHGFAGGRRSHGNKHAERQSGSIGGGGRAGGRVIKGMRMGGRMGGDRITVKNLKVVNVDKENGLLYISGAIPGRRGTIVEVKVK
jgi:large subunit ribosomal protein L3